MPRRTHPQVKYVTFQLRVPEDTLKAFDQALKLGLINARSRNEAIVNLMRKALADISFVVEMFEQAEEEIERDPSLRNLPPELLQVQLAGKIMQKSDRFQEWNREMAELIMIVAAKLDNPEFEEFVNALKNLNGDGE